MPEVTAIARQGLAVGGPAEVGYDKQTLPYVPGSTLRGALAGAWIREQGIPRSGNPARAEFISLFENAIRYGPLFQEGTAVTPLSAAWCKYPATAACARWSADAAVEGEAVTCPHCGKGTETGKGEVTGVRVRRHTRTRLDEQGRAEDGNLYARHELQAGLTYRGQIAGWHPWLAQPREIWLGGRTSTTGLAEVRVASDSSDQPAAAIPASPRSDGALVVRFTSPAVIVDDAGRPELDPAGELLRVLGIGREALQASWCWTRPARVGGWHAASGLPKPAELAMAMGSVAVLQLREQPGDEQLQCLRSAGIGLRRSEGFGMVELNPPPWRRTPPPAAQPPDEARQAPSVLAPLSELALLQDETVVRWLIDRCRLVLIERERDPVFSHARLLEDRVAVYFDDPQADAVSALFASASLPAAIPILEQVLSQFPASPGDLR
jgi:CRISPR-associated protein Csx10